MLDNIEVLYHSSIRIKKEKIIYIKIYIFNIYTFIYKEYLYKN